MSDEGTRGARGRFPRHSSLVTRHSSPPLRVALVGCGGIGAVRAAALARAAIGHEGGPDFTQSWVTRHAVAGGGTLIDNGIHVLDLARYLLESQGGRIVEAQGYTINARWPVAPCEDNAFCLFRTDGDPA